MSNVVAVLLMISLLGGWALAFRLTRSHRSIRWQPGDGWQVIRSTLSYLLGLNLVFFSQEVALVVSKAWLPEMQATLFHNSHEWTGSHPDLDVWQGAGTLGLAAAGLLGYFVVRRSLPGSALSDIAMWTAFHGAIAATANVALGIIDPASESGESLAALGADGLVGLVIGVVAIMVLIGAATWFGPRLVDLSTRHGERFREPAAAILRPAILAVPLVFAFRLPLPEQGMAGVLLLLIGAPWAIVGAKKNGGPSPQPKAVQATVPAAVLFATAASIASALILSQGFSLG